MRCSCVACVEYWQEFTEGNGEIEFARCDWMELTDEICPNWRVWKLEKGPF